MEKDFDKWNTEKKTVDAKVINTELFFYSREIWWCSLGLNVGVETDGKHENFERPVLILKVFNKDMMWIVPITSAIKKELPFHYKFIFNENNQAVIFTQIRTISSKRLLRKIGFIPDQDFENILKRLRNLI